MKRPLVLLLLALVATVGWCSLPRAAKDGQIHQDELSTTRIYAYRDWQGTGVRVHRGDHIWIRAEGTWLYTPGEYHGPGGHRRYSAPSFYPMPGLPGGILIGRVGTDGVLRRVGGGASWRATNDGQIYLRINDDILSDNDGHVEIGITVESGEDDTG